MKSIVAVHSINTSPGGGWSALVHEFRIGKSRSITLYQQGTYSS